MSTNNDNTTTQNEVIAAGHKQLTVEELTKVISNNTVTGDYFYNKQWRLYRSYANPNGEIQGENDLGSFVEGTWVINEDASLTLEWDGYWDDWTGVAYFFEDKIKFYDTTSKKWRTTYTKIEAGELDLEL